MKTVCCYCNAVIRENGTDNAQVSHGICTSCSSRILATLGINISEYLPMFDAPVILLSRDVRVLEASAEAVRYLDKPAEKIIRSLAGEALDCQNSRLPEGCGKTFHCPGCVIRGLVQKTFETGTGADQRTAVIMQGTPEDPRPVPVLVSTRKIGETVLVRIEPETAAAGTG